MLRRYQPLSKRFFNISLIFLFLFAAIRLDAAQTPAGDSAVVRPKLVLALIVDQFRYDYLERFYKAYVPAGKQSGGFRRLLKEGASMKNSFYLHSGTNTGPGHSVLLSGMFPSHTGIVMNEWIDRKSGRAVYCASDTTVRLVGIASDPKSGQCSPRNMRVETVGDRWQKIVPESKVIGIALKDRGGIFPAGQKADAAFWFDPGSGKWISSTYYFPDEKLPEWVETFNQREYPESYLGRVWQRMLPAKYYPMPDDVVGEGKIPGEESVTFPHTIRDLSEISDPRFKALRKFDAILPTPFGDDLTVKFAKALIDGEKLGQRGLTDILIVSFSSLDYCSHLFGPESQEVKDLLLRLDRQFDDLFEFIQKRVGLENCLIVFSADHGACPLPELAPNKSGKRIFAPAFLDSLRTLVEPAYPGVIFGIEDYEVYLNSALIEKRGLDRTKVERFVAEQAMKLDGVVRAYTREERLNGVLLDEVGERVKRSFNPDRSGDIYLVLKPYAIFTRQTGTTHGSPYDYDRHVPLIFFGENIKPGTYQIECSPADIAPTLHQLLGLPEPEKTGYDGRVLSEILK
jgi:predicted AlkP superfamily pyrophosphatase or phosphodiesterase